MDVGVFKLKHQTSSDRNAGAFHFFHQRHAIVSKFDKDSCELGKELSNIFVVPNLRVQSRVVGRMSSEDGVTKGIHFDPSLEHFIVSAVENVCC